MKKILICAWPFCTYIKYNQDNERYMHRKEGLYAVKQLFRISWKKTVMAYSDKVKRHLVKQFIQHGIATKQTDTSGQLYIEG